MDAPASPTVPQDTLPVVLTLAVQGDAGFLYDLWDNEARRQSLSGGPPTFEAHLAWLKAVLADPHVFLFVAIERGVRVGSARLDADGSTATVSVNVARSARRRGLGAAILRALDTEARAVGVGELVAEILEGNPGSRTAFLNAGYRLAEWKDGVVTMRRTLQ